MLGGNFAYQSQKAAMNGARQNQRRKLSANAMSWRRRQANRSCQFVKPERDVLLPLSIYRFWPLFLFNTLTGEVRVGACSEDGCRGHAFCTALITFLHSSQSSIPSSLSGCGSCFLLSGTASISPTSVASEFPSGVEHASSVRSTFPFTDMCSHILTSVAIHRGQQNAVTVLSTADSLNGFWSLPRVFHQTRKLLLRDRRSSIRPKALSGSVMLRSVSGSASS
jgi:hypothetical protein